MKTERAATHRDYYRLYKYLRDRRHTDDIEFEIDLTRIKNWLADCMTAEKYNLGILECASPWFGML